MFTEHPPSPLPTRLTKTVEFAAPKAVIDGPPRCGHVKDAVESGPHKDDEWGWYMYFAELIAWDGGGESIRLAYYYAPFGSKS
jgi:hypothetical protein